MFHRVLQVFRRGSWGLASQSTPTLLEGNSYSVSNCQGSGQEEPYLSTCLVLSCTIDKKKRKKKRQELSRERDYTCCNSPGHGFWNATSGSVLTQISVLQINGSHADDVIGRETVPVHDSDLEGVVDWELGRQFKHLPKHGVEVSSDVVVFVVDRLLANGDLQVRIRLPIWVLWLEVDTLGVKGQKANQSSKYFNGHTHPDDVDTDHHIDGVCGGNVAEDSVRLR